MSYRGFQCYTIGKIKNDFNKLIMKRLLIMFNIKYPSEIMELSICPIGKLIHVSFRGIIIFMTGGE
ncbi:hypothetical protein GCM10025860_17120 [Methanobacterium ferruginis]|nr:hypothetical protein GCM10025860_17120 [Methanobacterium ferruginis]